MAAAAPAEDEVFDDGGAAAWYAAAAAADEEDDEDLVEDFVEGEFAEGGGPVEDPYLVVEDLEVAEDPYLAAPAEAVAEAEADPYQGTAAAAPAAPAATTAVKRSLDEEAAGPNKAPRVKMQDLAPAKVELQSATNGTTASSQRLAVAPPAPPMPDVAVEAVVPDFRGQPGEEIDLSAAAMVKPMKDVPEEDAAPEALASKEDEGMDDVVEVADEAEAECEEQPAAHMVWDEKCVVVRQGQLHIELMGRTPPMDDAVLLDFCNWLGEQLPVVVKNFPYLKNSGAYIDLSDNSIGPEGLGTLFTVLREHRVPCVVVKAYRNCLDDSIVDSIIEYLYTQPESFPMHGIHISHNKVTDKGAMRLIRAAAQCGHYPRLTSRLPLWLRLECNDIISPQKVVADCLGEQFHVCLMQDGQCSRPNCNHYSGVHVQLPYFYNQHGRSGPSGEQPQPKASVQPWAAAVPKLISPRPVKAIGAPAEKPDWMSQGLRPSHSTNASVRLMQAAPKRMPVQPSAAPVPRPTTAWVQPQPPQNGDFGGGGCGAKGAGYGFAIGMSGKGGGGGTAGCGCKGGGDWGKGGAWGKGKGGDMGKGGEKGKGGGKGKGKGKEPFQLWQGVTLVQKVKYDVKLTDADPTLGFTWRMTGAGTSPQVASVDYGSTASQAAMVGKQLLRINGLDSAMFNEKQLTDMLRQRPISLRFGDQ